MNRGTAVNKIKRVLSWSKSVSDIIAELEISQGRLERGIRTPDGKGVFMPWFLTSEVQTALTQANEDRVPLPTAIGGVHTGMLSEYEDASLWVLDPDAESTDPWNELEKMPFDRLQEKWPGTGLPKGYSLIGVYFRLRYIPDAAYQLKIITSNGDLIPTSDEGTNKWLTYAPELLYAHAGIQMATTLRDQVALQQFKEIYTDAVFSLWGNTESRKHMNREYTMGGED